MIQQLDKSVVSRGFSQAASSYEQAASLQLDISEQLLERLEFIQHQPERVVDLGCGTGRSLNQLKITYPNAAIIGMDLSLAMLASADFEQLLCADIEKLPFRDKSVDMLFSNLAFQWCNDLEATLVDFKRVLVNDGVLLFSTFGAGTLNELRAAWQSVDDKPHVHTFLEMKEVGDLMLRNGFINPVVDTETIVVNYPDVMSLMRELQHIGANNAQQKRSRGLLGKAKLEKVVAAYEKFMQNEKIPASYEVVYGYARV